MRTETLFAFSDDDISQIYGNPEQDVVFAQLVNDECVQLNVEKKAERMTPSLTTQMIVNCVITSLGRIALDQGIRAVHQVSGSICYVDTDSLKLLVKKEKVDDLKKLIHFHDYILGAWKNECPPNARIGQFDSIGAKCYSQTICEQNSDKILYVDQKIKGINMKSHHVKEHVKSSALHDLIM